MGAIFIPSNRIFSIDNDKILDNIIDKVEIEVGVPSIQPQDDYVLESLVQKESEITSITDFYDASGNLVETGFTTAYQELANSNANIGDNIVAMANASVRVRAYCSMESPMFIPVKMYVYYNNEKRTINYPIDTIDISYTLTCKVSKYNATFNAGLTPLETTTTALKLVSTKGLVETTYEQNQETEVTYTYTGQDIGDGAYYTSCTAKLPVAESIILSKNGVASSYYSYKQPIIGAGTTSSNEKFFTVEFYIPYYGTLSQAGYCDYTTNIVSYYIMDGTYSLYSPTTLTINVKGKAYVLDLENETQSYGSGENIYSISNNELIQSTNQYRDDYAESQSNQIEFLCNNILDEYANGKEKAVIECAVNTYYDEDGNKVIDPYTASFDKPLFEIGDEVIPLVFKPKSSTIEPLSKYSDKTNKVFKVVGNKVEYKGAPFQTLTLQEIKHNNG